MTEEPHTGPSAVAGKAGTHLVDHGGPANAPLVLLIHGLGGSSVSWQLVAPILAQHYRVIAMDFYGHGRSSSPKNLRVEHLVTQMEAAIDAGLAGTPRPVILVAGSFGAMIAFQTAAAHPDLVQSIVAVNGAIPVHPSRRLDLAMTFKRWLISIPGVSGLIFRKSTSMTSRQYVEMQLAQAGVDPHGIDPRLMEASVELEDGRHQDRAAHDSQQALLRDLLRMFARGRSFTEMASAVRAPVLWLHSDNDPLIDFETAKEFVASRPSWQFRSRPGLGHVPMLTDPNWVADQILSWLDETDHAGGNSLGLR